MRSCNKLSSQTSKTRTTNIPHVCLLTSAGLIIGRMIFVTATWAVSLRYTDLLAENLSFFAVLPLLSCKGILLGPDSQKFLSQT